MYSLPVCGRVTFSPDLDLADAYTKATNRPWTQPIGFQHALFEVAIDVLKRAKNPTDPKAVLAAIAATDYQSIVGAVKWTGQPVKNRVPNRIAWLRARWASRMPEIPRGKTR